MDLTRVNIDPKRLRGFRSAAGIGQAEAARRVGISRQQLWNYETGLFTPTADTLARLCILYGVPMESLIDAPTPAAAL